ncbi:threonyl-tRNA synthetase [Hydrogenobacter thermophilus TK-6]|uniref:Threonine--tRNA ligase n=1 Tax=Hydrogenobacter thermophilus (strain DSM 6534 / IAM 12695 / TK-6) TaxID=608538 RepID=D3DIU7_HYDTT|nr:threonine--tRNA ligase [Hydrogenobacter thermophilus]ADO45676.1 threonyl-tRNA synthetase [Hydrogenobacter thermophilus TK-6]BAI69749.1 threonyl-tRNA synthetase [Hydrogenobacter thermophilus TK-6]
MIRVVIEDKVYEVEAGTPLGEIYQMAGVENAVGGKVNGKIYDLQTPIREDANIVPIYKSDPESLEILRHSLAHIMAQALKEIYGKEKVHLGVGPTTEEGFYYDVEIEGVRLSEDDLSKIEEKMREIIQRNYPILRRELDREEAIKLFEKLREKYKLEIIKGISPDDVISVYEQNDFVDLCRGPHLPTTGMAGAFKLTHISGAYWRGDSSQPMLQRIYGMAFWDSKELEERLKFYEEAKKRDHRKLGRDLEFFIIDEDVGPGLVLWLPKGGIYRKILEDYWREEHLKRGYQFVYTPHIGNAKLWQISGHLDYYRPNMFSSMQVDQEEYFVKPMNCPFHIAIYKSKVRSYKELPLKLAELGTVYRYEMSGVLHGLMRVRGFTQDDAHIICTEEQVEDVIHQTLEFAISMLRDFGFEEFKVYISTKPEDAIGSPDQWQLAENSLKKAVESMGIPYQIDEGGGAFYGPKIDVKIKDAIGRLWQCSTIQFDFNLPERFDMEYVGPDNKRHRPYMIHRALLGSIERFTGILLEHYAGALPVWLSPVQVRLIPIGEAHMDYTKKLENRLKEEGLRVEVDDRDERLSAKIRDAEVQKIPYVIVIGDKEVSQGKISVRSKKEGNLGSMSVEEFIKHIKDKIKSKAP